MRRILKGTVLSISLFLFLLVVVGGGLHLNPAGALLAAVTGTLLIIHAFNCWDSGARFNLRQTLSGDAHSMSGVPQPPPVRTAVLQGSNSSQHGTSGTHYLQGDGCSVTPFRESKRRDGSVPRRF